MFKVQRAERAAIEAVFLEIRQEKINWGTIMKALKAEAKDLNIFLRVFTAEFLSMFRLLFFDSSVIEHYLLTSTKKIIQLFYLIPQTHVCHPPTHTHTRPTHTHTSIHFHSHAHDPSECERWEEDGIFF